MDIRTRLTNTRDRLHDRLLRDAESLGVVRSRVVVMNAAILAASAILAGFAVLAAAALTGSLPAMLRAGASGLGMLSSSVSVQTGSSYIAGSAVASTNVPVIFLVLLGLLCVITTGASVIVSRRDVVGGRWILAGLVVLLVGSFAHLGAMSAFGFGAVVAATWALLRLGDFTLFGVSVVSAVAGVAAFMIAAVFAFLAIGLIPGLRAVAWLLGLACIGAGIAGGWLVARVVDYPCLDERIGAIFNGQAASNTSSPQPVIQLQP